MNNKPALWQKIERLEMSVIQDPPAEVDKIFRELGKVEFTARALGLACRYRGLDMVKVLVENGAILSFDPMEIKPAFRRSRLVWLDWLYGDENYSLGLLSAVARRETYELNNIGKSHCGINLVPSDERLQTLDYLLKNADKIGFKADEILFYAYLADEREMIDFLKSKGVRASERLLKIITEGANNDDWLNYCFLTGKLTDGEFLRVMGAIIEECGGRKLHFTEKLWEYNKSRFEKPEFLKFLLEHFNQAKMNKNKILKDMIDCGSVECLTLCAEHGWLKTLRKCDEMTRYATENGKTECAAWLLEFQNRNFDLTLEREKAEKKAERELNAAPDSVTAMKQIWSYKKCEGGIIITGYKGNRTEVTVPEKIGKDAVIAIGDHAFCPFAARIKPEAKDIREEITKITLPDTVRSIGRAAFWDCKSLISVNIPDGVTEIGENTFAECHKLDKIIIPSSVRTVDRRAFYWCDSLKFLEIPEGVEVIGDNAFSLCAALTAVVERGSYAEKYCKENGIKFVYKES